MKKYLKKAVAVMLTIAMFVCSVSLSSSADTYSANSAVTYNVYDGETGALLRTYTLEANPYPATSSSYAVIGDDDRNLDYSKSGVVSVVTSDDDGTGFFVDENIIATAAHIVCGGEMDVSSDNGVRVESIKMYNQDGSVAKTITDIAEVHVPVPFIENGCWSGTAFDYALISFSENLVDQGLGDYMCFDLGVMRDEFVIKSVSASAAGLKLISVTGFPGDANKTGMYTASGNVLNEDIYGAERLFYHNVDTFGGDSGAPIYMETEYKNQKYYTVIGIHIGQDGSINANIGARMTTELLHFYKNNGNINY